MAASGFGTSPAGRALQYFGRRHLAVASAAMLLLLVLAAIFAPYVTPYDPNFVDLMVRNQPPSAEHWFGTDRTGRDMFTRTVYAARVSLAVGIAAVGIALLIGTVLGALSGYFGGVTDNLIMRFTDVVMTFPVIIILLTVAAIVGPGLMNTILIIGFLTWPVPCRLVRSKFLALREEEFVQASRALGARSVRTIMSHVLPNSLDVIVVYGTLGVANAILLEAGLSFLGLGIQPPTSSWGNMLNLARNLTVLELSPWQWIPPGGAILITVLSINFLGDTLRDVLDPRMR
jgi:peptide/nickel transport system permease protein